jgi:tRNA (mo5U34)-methyltransferase
MQSTRAETSFSREELERMVRSVPFWFHTIDLGRGVSTPGAASPEMMRERLEALRLPDFRGKTVLDIGAFDGFFSFEAERRGASRVVALDHFVWSLDMAEVFELRRAKMEEGRRQLQPEESHLWRPDELPGKRGFDTAHRALGSRVESVVCDFMEAEVGTFDIVLFMGVLYHVKDMLGALKKVASMTREVAVIETDAVEFPGYEDSALCEFFESDELNFDPTNWWAPNVKALVAMCRASGFDRVEVVQAAPPDTAPKKSFLQKARGSVGSVLREFAVREPLPAPEPVRFRAAVHAYKRPA